MPVAIIRREAIYHMIAEHALYLDATKTRIIVVKDGEEVPPEAAFVLAGKGGKIAPQYEKLVEALETKVEPEPKPEPPPPIPQVPLEPETTPELKAAKPKKEKAISA